MTEETKMLKASNIYLLISFYSFITYNICTGILTRYSLLCRKEKLNNLNYNLKTRLKNSRFSDENV